MTEMLPTTLAMFARPEWFTDPTTSSLLLRLYTIVGVAESEAATLLRDVPSQLDLMGPVRLCSAVLAGVKPLRHHLIVHSDADGAVVLNTRVDQPELPRALYLALSTPLAIDGQNTGEYNARQRLSMAAGLAKAVYGIHFLRDLAFEGIINASTGVPSVMGPMVRTPQGPDGPFLHIDLSQRLSAIRERLATQSDDIATRLRLALTLIDRAKGRESYFYYWSALEVVAGGRTGAIRTALAQAYGFRSYPDVDTHLGFGTLARWRHDYYHRGIEPALHSPVERYLQMMLLELIALRLSLKPLGLLLAVQGHPGWDLTELGLPYAATNGA